ncbi:MAG: hypothetical protein J5710_06875 [Treponema sp.]|nr:hypothetical protein [Treponema sp.]
MNKQAIFHVDNTEGVVDFAKFLSNLGWTILSANRTEEVLRKAKIPVVKEPALSENNLYLNDTSGLIQRIMSSSFIDEPNSPVNQAGGNIGIICMNVTPTLHNINSEKKLKAITKPFNFFVSTILRNAFLNYENILILCDPDDYKEAMVQIRTDSIDKEFRIYLAAKALNLVSAFDGGIASSILMNNPDEVQKSFINYLTYPFEKQYMLQKGSNSHQNSCLYRFPGGTGTVGSLQKQQGKELSYNTISDISFAWEQICMFSLNLKNQFSVKTTNCDGYHFETQFTPLTGTVFTIAVKYKSILGACISSSTLNSFKNTFTYDAENVKRVTLACSAVIDEAAAEEIVKGNFAAVVAPGFTQGAKDILSTVKKMELIQIARITTADYEMELINGGLLFQNKDKILFDHWDVKTKTRPGQILADQMAFGTILSMGSRTFSAVLVKDNTVVGISQACKSSVRAVDVALSEALLHRNQNADNTQLSLADVLVCDSVTPLCDSIRQLAENGLKAIIQPGGAQNDEEFINFCNDHLISMIFTNMPHISY